MAGEVSTVRPCGAHPGSRTRRPRVSDPVDTILSLAKTYSGTRLEAASQRALLLGVYSYQSLKSILKRSLDQQPMLDLDSDRSGPNHDNIRGPRYYDRPPNEFLQ